jgi:hypothetical protein
MDENPYAPPSIPWPEQTVYYAMDVARASLAEIWRVSYPNLIGVAFVVLSKLLGRPVRGNVGIAHGSLRFVEVSQAPGHVATALEPICRDCETLAFRQRFVHSIAVLGDGEAYAIASSNQDGTISSQAIYVRSGTRVETIVAFVSFLEDDTVLSTTNGRRRLRTPPDVNAAYLPRATVGQVLAHHESRVARVTNARPRCLDDAGLREAVARNARLAAKFHEARGVYVPLTNAEVAKLTFESERISK